MARTKGAKNKKKPARKVIPVGIKGAGKSVSHAAIKRGDKKAIAEANRILNVSAKKPKGVWDKKKNERMGRSVKKAVNFIADVLDEKGIDKQQDKNLPTANDVFTNEPIVERQYELKPPATDVQEEAAPLDEVVHNRPEISRPYILKIKNNSMTKIEGFRVNNIKQALQQGKEYDDRVTVTYGLHGYTYQAFLSHFVTHPTKFGRVRYEAFHGYQKYQQQQLMSCPLYVLGNEPNGDSTRTTVVLEVALNQFITTAVEKEVNFDFTDLSWDLRLDLYPEVEVTIYLYPAIIGNLWTGERKELARPDIGGVARIADSDENARLKKIISSLEAQLANANMGKKESKESDAAFAKDEKK